MPPEKVLEGLYRNRSQGSEQLQTVFAMYNQELSRDRVAPSYQELGIMLRKHIDQTIRARNFKARNARTETGVLVKSQQGRNVSAERKVGECWKAKSVQKNLRGTCTEPSCDFWHPPVCLNHKSESGCKYGDT